MRRERDSQANGTMIIVISTSRRKRSAGRRTAVTKSFVNFKQSRTRLYNCGCQRLQMSGSCALVVVSVFWCDLGGGPGMSSTSTSAALKSVPAGWWSSTGTRDSFVFKSGKTLCTYRALLSLFRINGVTYFWSVRQARLTQKNHICSTRFALKLYVAIYGMYWYNTAAHCNTLQHL